MHYARGNNINNIARQPTARRASNVNHHQYHRRKVAMRTHGVSTGGPDVADDPMHIAPWRTCIWRNHARRAPGFQLVLVRFSKRPFIFGEDAIGPSHELADNRVGVRVKTLERRTANGGVP
eukprot:scaffold19116_cov33-Tisochrysis_lutea.AAC.1